MIEVYKTRKGADKVNKKLLFTKTQNIATRGFPLKLTGHRFKINNKRKYLKKTPPPPHS